MASIAPKISSLSSVASTKPNNISMFLISNFCCTGKVSYSSLADTAKSSIPSCVYTPISSPVKQFDHKASIEYLHELNIKKVKNILIANQDDLFENLEIIDVIQGLGISLYFQYEIDQILHMVHKNCIQLCGRDFRKVALCFRLLRQEGHYVQESMFENIQDKKGGFKDELRNDVKGLVELYEASELSVEGEETLSRVREFAFNRLNELCSGLESHQDRIIMRQPRHKTLKRLTSNRFFSMIKIAGKEEKEWLQSLLRVAEVDSIIMKSLIQEEMSQIFKWWKELGLEKELKKARNQPMKWHTWSLEMLGKRHN